MDVSALMGDIVLGLLDRARDAAASLRRPSPVPPAKFLAERRFHVRLIGEQRARAEHWRSSRRSDRSRSGQALVEFAIILPMMLFLLLIAVDFGRLYATKITLTNAAKEGASYAIQHPNDASGGWVITQSVVRQEATDPSVAVTVISAGGTVTVNATEKFSFLTPFISTGFSPLWHGFGGPLTIGASGSGDQL
jgi:TadE-like protein